PFPPDPGEPRPDSSPPLERTTTDAGTDAVIPAPGTGVRPPLPDLSATEDAQGAADSSAERAGPLSHWGLKVRPTQPVGLGAFRLLRKLGSGSMGAVYFARQLSRDRDVALKVLFQHLAGKAGFVGRFEREARVLAGLRHPNIVCLYERGEADGFHYLAMEHIDGPSPWRVLTGLGGRLPLGDALHVVLRCAAGLGHAHERHIVHRDVKPSNIMLTQLGQVKLTDLGLAKHVDEDPSLTDSGATLGTPQYV